MQLNEALLWLNFQYNINNKFINKILTKTIKTLIYFQPFIASINYYKNNDKLILLNIILSLIFIIISLKTQSNTNYTYIGKNHHLVWTPFLYNLYYKSLILQIYYVVLFIIPAFKSQNKKYILFWFLTWLYSYTNYYKSNEMSSKWCYIANTSSILLLYDTLMIYY